MLEAGRNALETMDDTTCPIRNHYTLSQKMAMVDALRKMVEEGSSHRNASYELGMDPSQMQRWCHQYHTFKEILNEKKKRRAIIWQRQFIRVCHCKEIEEVYCNLFLRAS